MKRRIGEALLLLMTAAGFALSQDSVGQPPSFESFRVPEYTKKPVRAKILTASDRQFRTRIREGATKGPNFAGHFTVVSWGCGSGCLSFVVVDAASGKVNWSSPFHVLGMPYKGAQSGSAYRGLQYKPDSSLLIVDGCPEDKNERCGSYYYEWRNQSFRLISFNPGPPAGPN